MLSTSSKWAMSVPAMLTKLTPPPEYDQVALDRLGKTLTEAHRHAHQTQQRARKNAVSYPRKNSNCTCKCSLLSLTLALILITQLAIAIMLYSRESDVKPLETTPISKGDMKILISEHFNDAQEEAIALEKKRFVEKISTVLSSERDLGHGQYFYHNSFYEITEHNTFTHLEGRKYCEGKSMRLVSILSRREQLFINRLIKWIRVKDVYYWTGAIVVPSDTR